MYKYFGDDIALPSVVQEVPSLKAGGTLGVMLAVHALRRGYRATIYTYNLRLFDPTWMSLPGEDVILRLRRQARFKKREKLQRATRSYVEFLQLGGTLKIKDLTPRLLRHYLNRGIPVLAGLSSTYLYQACREYGPDDVDDDIRGHPSGHFVLLRGYDRTSKTVLIADPLKSNPYSSGQRYELSIDRVICSILLGIATDDANLVILEPPTKSNP